MNKRGILLKTIELIFSAVLILAFIVLVVKLVYPAIAGEKGQADADFERYIEEVKRVRIGWPDVPVRVIGTKFGIIFYNKDSQGKPEECLQNACACLYEGIDNFRAGKAKRCEELASATTFAASPTYVQFFVEGRLEPPVYYICKGTDEKIKITNEENQC